MDLNQNSDDSNLDLILTFLNECFLASVTPTVSKDENSTVNTTAPQYTARWKTRREILMGVADATKGGILSDLDLALNFLLKREVIAFNDLLGNSPEVYCITYEGRKLLRDGGYAAETLRKTKIENEERSIKKYSFWVALAGLIISIFSLYYSTKKDEGDKSHTEQQPPQEQVQIAKSLYK